MREKNNPYTLVFGKAPLQIIPRDVQTDEIVEAFTEAHPTRQVFMITGVRGSGKTVMMTEVAGHFRKEKNWVVVELNPEKDLLEGLVAKLASERSLIKIFRMEKINLSFFGINIGVESAAQIYDVETAIIRMLKSLQKNGKKLLITVDEAISTKDMKVFASSFQIFLRGELPVYLLMTGLYENIHTLQNQKSLTFLYRAPKIELGSLNLTAIAENYKKNFNISKETAHTMAKLTKGYSFAFQVLGYLVWKHGGLSEEVLHEYRYYLDEYVYEKIWNELSAQDQRIAYGVAMVESGKISEIRAFLKLDTNQFNPYRKRLIKRGIINAGTYGYVTLALPLFGDFVRDNYGEHALSGF